MTHNYSVHQPEEPSLYEQYLGHRMDDDSVPQNSHVGHAHADGCMDCAADPAMAAAVAGAEARIKYAIDECKVFFSEDTPEALILNIILTGTMALDRGIQ